MQCPFFDVPDGRAECRSMTRMENLDHALAHCCGDFRGCSVFWQQVKSLREQRRRENVAATPTPAAAAAASIAG